MALWEIQHEDGRYAGYRNSGETAEQAIEEWWKEKERPVMIGVSKNAELEAEGCVEYRKNERLSAAYGSDAFDLYVKFTRQPMRAVRMRQIWIDAGYSRVPA